MTPPSAVLATASLLTAAALLLGGCGSATAGPGRQTTVPQPSGSVTAPPATSLPVPRVPPPRDVVTAEGLVLQHGDDPAQLCLGPVAASVPLQCDGVPLVGWSWGTAEPQEQSVVGGTASRSGTYAVQGHFDGRALTVTRAVPLAPGEASDDPTPRPSAPPRLDAARWDAILGGLAVTPGLVERGPLGDGGPILVTVVYDDGTLQAWADASFGAGTVVVTSALR